MELTGTIYVYYDQMVRFGYRRIRTDKQSQSLFPMMYGAGIEEPYRFTIFDFSVSSIKAIKGTPLTKERETENGEFLLTAIILADRLLWIKFIY